MCEYWPIINSYRIQVILDLGHVTFGNVMDWSCESVSIGVEPGLDDDDDGK